MKNLAIQKDEGKYERPKRIDDSFFAWKIIVEPRDFSVFHGSF